MSRKIFLIFGVTLLLAACATQKDWVATGGSRSDATVELSYQYGGFEKPVLSEGQAYSTASRRCEAWGYGGTEAFGGTISKCNGYNQYGCTAWIVTATFQCVD